MNKLLSINEAAVMLKVSKTTLRRWDDENILKAIRIKPGGHRKYSEELLEKFIKSKQS